MPSVPDIFYNFQSLDDSGSAGHVRHSTNLKAFKAKVEDKITNLRLAIETGCRTDDISKGIHDWIEDLYRDYLSRITTSKPLDSILPLAERWKKETDDILSDLIEPLATDEDSTIETCEIYIKIYEAIENTLNDIIKDLDFELANGNIRQEIEPERKSNAGKRAKTFEDCILGSNKQAVIDKLRQMIDGKKGKDVCIILMAAVEAGLITKPSHKAASETFGRIGVESNFNRYMRIADNAHEGLHKSDITPIVNQLNQHFSI